MAHTLRRHKDFIQELDYVALVDGRVVGNIMYTRAGLANDAGESLEIASFGPLCVHPEFQRMGIGSRLIRHSLPVARRLGFGAVAIYGSPHNYCKHGFKNGKDLGISDGNGDYPYGLLALELTSGMLAGQLWRLQISPAFDCRESEVEAFDSRFPPKEKGYQCSQEIFAIEARSFLR
jgi:putative acetyltransferase